MGRLPVGMDELVEHWTVLDDERELVAGKRGATRLGFALLLKYYTRHGLTPLFWGHVRPYGEVRLDLASRLAIGLAGTGRWW